MRPPRLSDVTHPVRSLSALRDRLPGAPRPADHPATGASELGAEPLLSVVVPVYQVEDYLAECLDSLLSQTYRHLEIVVVDDGSTDGSGAIAADYAARDQRIVVVRQENCGLGAARNTGLAHCTGDLVAFADSDDTVPAPAYGRMVRTLQVSGSDFVVGAMVREVGGVDKVRRWVKREHARRRLAVTIDEVPDMLINVVACTKVFRRDFVHRVGLHFPEAVRYEDQVPMTQAYLRARTFDVIPDVVYRWRTRDDQTSITQQKTDINDLVDRLAAERQVAEFLHGVASDKVLRRWYLKTFHHDFLSYLKLAGDADDDYWNLLQESIISIARRAPTDLDDDIELRVRIAVWLAREGHRKALRKLVRQDGFASSNFPLLDRDGGQYADVSFLEEEVTVPDSLLLIRAGDRRLRPRLEALSWAGGAGLTVRCVAAVNYVDPTRHDVDTWFTLVGPDEVPPVQVPTRVDADAVGNVVARRAHEDHERSVVSGDLDLPALVEASPTARAVTKWELQVIVTAMGTPITSSMDTRRRTGSAVVPRSVLTDGSLVSSEWSERRGLLVVVRRRFAALTGASYVDGVFRLHLQSSGLPTVTRIVIGGKEVPATVTATGADGSLVIEVPGRPQGGTARAGRVRIGGSDSQLVQVAVVSDLDPVLVGDGTTFFRTSHDGQLVAVADVPCLLVDDVRVGDGIVTLSGRLHGARSACVFLRGPHARTPSAAAEVHEGVFTVPLEVRSPRFGDPPTALPAGTYAVVVNSLGSDVRVLAGRLFDEAGSAPPQHGWSVAVGADRKPTLRRARHEDMTVFSYQQQSLLRQHVYGEARRRAPRDVAVFEAFGGSGTGDGPRAVSDLLQERGASLDLVWSVDDWSVAPPPGTRAVLRKTPEWYEAMGSCRLLVSNNTFPWSFRKSPEQVYVQTWHGTPLKRIGTDVVNPRLSTEHHRRLLLREVASWDVLVSPSPFCTEVFRRALGYGGEILELGRPSNDLLLAPEAGGVRDTVRAQLGIAEGQTVLLYAPTWRDDGWRGNAWEKVLHLDHRRVTAARQDVTVLVRGHPNTASRADVVGQARVIDVTSYPDIARLYLAADLLVTDYSGAMFDFALTDKPIIILAPDLEAYRDRVRGLYWDFEEVAPGPVVRDTDEVIDLMGDGRSWGSARARMRATFAPYDDGAATARLVDAVLPALSS